MRNKGFFWFLTILLTAVCVYQLSFTWVASNVEGKANKEADARVNELFAKVKSKGETLAELPNDTEVDITNPEARELAKAAFLNQILKEKADTKVYPGIGSTFSDVKKSSLAFGLDLVGGMSVTLEISIPGMVEEYANNKRDIRFKKAFDRAVSVYNAQGGDFIEVFAEANQEVNNGTKLAKLIKVSEFTNLKFDSSDNDVISALKEKATSSMEGVELIMSRRINQFGVAQPNIQKDPINNRLYIELPGVQDETTVATKLQSTANLQFFETYTMSAIANYWQQAVMLSKQKEIVVEDIPVDTLSVKDSSATKSKTDKLTASLSTEKGLDVLVKPYSDVVVGFVDIKDKQAVDKIIKRNDIINALPEDVRLMWSADEEAIDKKGKVKGYFLYAIRVNESGEARVSGKDVQNATASIDEDGSFSVDLKMTDEGVDKWGEMTSDNVNHCIAITMDNLVFSAPNVQNAIYTSTTKITGNFTNEEAKDLSNLLNGGALPAPCVIKEQTKVGPTIGAENSTAGLVSFAFAFLAVLLYMYWYYGKAGLVANIALAVNVIFIFGSLASFGAVLTLAGIAGIVLTIGTAVDANILIFERVREEMNRGVQVSDAINIGFKKALPSIIDANVTHLLVAIILKVFGKGEIESFATTLIIGIFTSMFSAIVISKLVFTAWLAKGKTITFNTAMSKGLFQNFHFDWVGKRKYFYMFSISSTIIGVVALFTLGLKQSVEFTGGRTLSAKFEQKVDIEVLRSALEKVLVEKGETASIDLKTKSNDFNVEIVTNYKLKNDGATEEVNNKIKEGLDACKSKMGGYQVTNTRSVSASISSELWSSSAVAITFALIAIFAYILLRFGHWQYSIGAIIGLAHDAFFVITIFSLLHGHLPFSLDVNQAFIAAILTVIGYSMNDTVIVFDRIRENLRNSKEDDHHHEIINKSLNTTLSRTFNTSMILFVVVLIMFIFGGPAIKGFLFALLVGVVIGTYSSLCVATPILIDFSKKLKK
ncbi:MAG: protein translocase subunit SecD [Flavobacteriia bacterium]|nr:protein translocase subunit SecD [Flavobacteriia bacterium]